MKMGGEEGQGVNERQGRVIPFLAHFGNPAPQAPPMKGRGVMRLTFSYVPCGSAEDESSRSLCKKEHHAMSMREGFVSSRLSDTCLSKYPNLSRQGALGGGQAFLTVAPPRFFMFTFTAPWMLWTLLWVPWMISNLRLYKWDVMFHCFVFRICDINRRKDGGWGSDPQPEDALLSWTRYPHVPYQWLYDRNN